MRNALKFGMLALAGWVAYSYLRPRRAAAATTTAPATTAPAAAGDLVRLMEGESLKRGFAQAMNPHEWNWLYSQVRGEPAPAPDPAFPDVDDLVAHKVSLAEWYAAMRPLGVSGGNLGGLWGPSWAS